MPGRIATYMITLIDKDFETFDRDGFLIVENVLDEDMLEAARAHFEPLFSGRFETGLYPDEWNWKTGKDRPDVTRQICNGWKSDRTIASIVLREDVGRACAELRGWSGARINQDNIIWKPPGTKPLGFHQDESYQDYYVPGEMMTCWITLDDTRADQGTIEYVPGSHKWPLAGRIKQFHAPDDPLEDLRPAAEAAGVGDYEIVPIVVKAGTAVIHHGRTWHGSRDNRGVNPRRSVVSHCMPADVRFHPTNIGYIYSRYRRASSLEMDEGFFPVLWRRDGYRSVWIERFLKGAPIAG
ncbi:MAG: phytanoyl-CoA dioxygenase family protein [Hyphomicrobiaceae bacterium]